MPSPPRHERLLWAIFFASGFAGLIYESIWTHYLKLFLGHAAYAQTLVLAIFMGGMAGGAALAARFSERVANPLRLYALVEGLIGLSAFLFHPVFAVVTAWLYDLGAASDSASTWFTPVKWAVAALLILPQSALLGATFPLFAGAATRGRDVGQGRVIAILYFANSLGGAIGVLASGFFLIPALGLPGTIAGAGALNLLIALAASRLGRPQPVSTDGSAPAATPLDGLGWFLLAVSFLTGASSFIYEVGWIRMLSLVLGSATHSFELMLAAFITGLALGGLWIRKRIDSVASPGVLLGYVQLAMGCAAVATLPLHNLSFDLVAWTLQTVPRTETGYAFFNAVRYCIASLIMFPAAFCAGMTLPLVTRALCARPGQHERAIGLVYSANTVGAICGLSFAVLVGLPFIGLEYLIASGALVDVLLGAALLAVFAGRRKLRLSLAATAACVFGSVAAAATFDPTKLVSGVFRNGKVRSGSQIASIAHGRTATISTETSEGAVIIRTNGKTDATAMPGYPPTYQLDEVTMTLAAAIPLSLHPQPRRVANVGFGSGITGETLLGDPRVAQLDSIEIEPRMVELARQFTGRNERLFTDGRSRIHIDDAKAYFAAAGGRYDLIVSEPSNPWVSGVAGLFSVEFYRHVQRYLADDGLFAQWLQVYETHPDRIASVLKAVGEAFADYLVFAVDRGDLLIVARPRGRVPAADIDPDRLSPLVRQWLARLDIAGRNDIVSRIMGDKALFAPWIASRGVPANSDYWPYIDNHADRDRFVGNATGFVELVISPYPVSEALGGRPPLAAPARLGIHRHLGLRPPTLEGNFIAEALLGEPLVAPPSLPGGIPAAWRREALQMLADCRQPPMGDHPYGVASLMVRVMPYLSAAENRALLAVLREETCFAQLAGPQQGWATLAEQLAARDFAGLGPTAAQLLEAGEGSTAVRARYLLGMAMLGHLAARRPDEALATWERHAATVVGNAPAGIELDLLLAHARTGARGRP